MKLFFLDTETTGLLSWKHGVIQIAGVIEVNKKVQEVVNISCAPFATDAVDPVALKLQQTTAAELNTRLSPDLAYKQLTKTLGKYVDKYDTKDKLTVIGYNIDFDLGFLEKWFTKNQDKYFGSWFNRRPMDIMSLAYYYRYLTGIELPDWKLKTICTHFGIKLDDAHNALADVNATRQLFYKLDEFFKGMT